MSDVIDKPGEDKEPKTRKKTARPEKFEVLLVNQDKDMRACIPFVLEDVFRMTAEQADAKKAEAFSYGLAVAVSDLTADVAETKALMANNALNSGQLCRCRGKAHFLAQPTA